MELPTFGLLILSLSACADPQNSKEGLNAYLADHADVVFEVCPDAEIDECGGGADTSSPSAVVLDCVYAAKQACTPAWGCITYITIDAMGEYCLLVEEGTCNLIYFNSGAVQSCETMEEPDGCFPVVADCTAVE